VFRLKHNPKNKGNCKRWWYQCTKTSEFIQIQKELTEQLYCRCWKCSASDRRDTFIFYTNFRGVSGPCWQQSVQCCVSVPPNFLGYSNKPFLWEITTEMGPARWSPKIAVVPSCWNRQCLICRHCPKADMIPVANASFVPKVRYQSLYCCLTLCFLVRIRIAKCFTDSGKRFRCEAIFENEHTLCSWKHRVRICTAFVKLAWAAA
jgi:hypothetical protein